jgi:hypothetical protein
MLQMTQSAALIVRACTVHVNGEAVRSRRLGQRRRHKKITTIEGLAWGDHPCRRPDCRQVPQLVAPPNRPEHARSAREEFQSYQGEVVAHMDGNLAAA